MELKHKANNKSVVRVLCFEMMFETFQFQKLPDLCIESILGFLAKEHPVVVAQCAANFSRTSKSMYEHSRVLWNALDPGCFELLDHRRLVQCQQKREFLKELETDWAEMVKPMDYKDKNNICSVKVSELKDICKKLGCASRGVGTTKAKLLESIEHAIELKNMRKKLIRMILREAPIYSAWKCPVHENVRAWISAQVQELKGNAKLITKSHAQFMGVGEADLAPLPVVYKPNPHYRNAPYVRLYNVVDIMYVIKSYRRDDYESYVEWLDRLVAEEQKIIFAERRRDKRRCQCRTSQRAWLS